MITHSLFRAISLSIGLLFLASCEPSGSSRDQIDVTQMLRIAPENFRVISVIPSGLGETGEAGFLWAIFKPEGGVEFSEAFEMQRVGQPRRTPQGDLQVTYKLRSADRARFQTQQIRQRAQLLAGFYHIGLNFLPDLCDQAGVAARSKPLFSTLIDTSTGANITTVQANGTAAELERAVPYCV